MTIITNKEDGTLAVRDNHTDMSLYTALTDLEALEKINEADFWDWADPEVWQALADNADIDPKDYDDPEDLFDALVNANK